MSVPGTERERVSALLGDHVVEPHLDAWAAEHGHGPDLSWRRDYGRVQQGWSPWAVLVYVADGGRLTLRVNVHDDPDTATGWSRWLGEQLGWLEVVPCRDDPALPGLGPVLDALENAVPVRYRPGNRCMVRGGTGEDERFVKVLSGAPDRQVDARALWAASRAGLFGFAVAEPHGWDAATNSTWYGVVPGVPIAPALLGPDGLAMARRIGSALAELADTPLHPTATNEPADQLARTGRTIRRAVTAVPALADRLDDALRLLSVLHADFSPRPLVPTHGSPHMHQWLDGDSQLGLVDFDRFGLGEPELDLATFLVELESESERAVPMADLRDAVIAGFESVAGPLDETRLAVYAAHKRLAKVARTTCGLRTDGPARAERRLTALADDLAALDRRVSV
jgi:hypothetical protein